MKKTHSNDPASVQTQQRRFTVMFSSPAGLQATTKHSGFPVRMDNAVPIVPQAPAAQPLQIQSGVLTQVKAGAALLRNKYFVLKKKKKVVFALTIRSFLLMIQTS